LVLSATYRQSTRTTRQLLEIDPKNRLLARGARFRMDGEMLRDTALAASGLLVEKMAAERKAISTGRCLGSAPSTGQQSYVKSTEKKTNRATCTISGIAHALKGVKAAPDIKQSPCLE